MIKKELEGVFGKLNEWIGQHNRGVSEGGEARIPRQEIRIVGQMALLLADLPFAVATSMDLDVVSPAIAPLRSQLAALLLERGIRLETELPHEMPPETKYAPIFDFPWIKVTVADPDSVIVVKNRLDRPKDQKLIETYSEYFPRIMARLK